MLESGGGSGGAGRGGRRGRPVVARKVRFKVSLTLHPDVYAEAAGMAIRAELSLSATVEHALVEWLRGQGRPVPARLA